MRKLNNRLELKARRRELRGSLTVAEARLWSCLQCGRLGWKFRRQHSIGPFIVDFYCPAGRLAIELDGAAHDSTSASSYDHKRSGYLRDKGVHVVRFVNDDVIQNLEGVLHMIRMELSAVERYRTTNRDDEHTDPQWVRITENRTTPPAYAGTPPRERGN
jgi:very-short-patch-repair endonuclease